VAREPRRLLEQGAERTRQEGEGVDAHGPYRRRVAWLKTMRLAGALPRAGARDARLALEHALFLSAENAGACSEILLSAAPPHVLARGIGLAMDSAYLLWVLALGLLDFAGMACDQRSFRCPPPGSRFQFPFRRWLTEPRAAGHDAPSERKWLRCASMVTARSRLRVPSPHRPRPHGPRRDRGPRRARRAPARASSRTAEATSIRPGIRWRDRGRCATMHDVVTHRGLP
jgi:hypothetical protein